MIHDDPRSKRSAPGQVRPLGNVFGDDIQGNYPSKAAVQVPLTCLMKVTEKGDVDALLQQCRTLGAAATPPDHRAEDARAVRIEDEAARRGIRLQGRGPEREGPCPVCGGTDRFSINTKKQVWNCRECSRGGDVIALVQHIDGSDFIDAIETLVGQAAAPKRVAEPKAWPLAMHFPYTDEAGILLSREVRLQYPDGRKKIWQEAADPDRPGRWITGEGCMTGVRRVPFELAKLNEALKAGETIFIVEGPRKCGPLQEWGLCSTCNSGGSGAASIWREHAKEFFLPVYSSPVVILPDNDAPGAKSAAIISDALASVGVAVSMLDLPVGPRGDIINWVEGGGTCQQFLDLVETEAREWEPSKPPREGRLEEGFSGNRPQSGEQKTFPLIAWKDIGFDLEEECRVEGVLPLVGLACFYGGPGSGKTFILLDLFARMARGGFWGGREVKQCPVVYIAAEGSGGIKKRIVGLKNVAAEKGLPADIPFHLITVAPNLGIGTGDCKKLIADIEARGVQPGAIAIDTTTQALAGADENGAGMDTLVVNAMALAVHFQCLVVLVHHTPVSDDSRLRGKGSLGGGLDASIIIKREKGSMAAALIVKKMRDEDDGQAFTVNLVRVVLGKTKKGREVSTLVVETVETGTAEGDKGGKVRGRKLPVSAENALSALRYALDEVGAVIPHSNHVVSGQKGVSVEQWREYAYKRSGHALPDTMLKDFVRGRDKLKAEGIVAILDTYVWLVK